MPNKHHPEQILILDFGSQYTQLIARSVREIGVYCHIQPCDFPNDKIAAQAPAGIILSGGPESATALVAPKIPSAVFDLNVPVLGICYGMQVMAKQLGGAVESSDMREFGPARVMLDWPQAPLIRGIADGRHNGQEYLDVWMSHGDRVIDLPEGFRQVASAADASSAAMMHSTKPLCGVQFHPEVTHTAQGRRILERFLVDLCGCHKRWTSRQAIDEIVDTIRDQVQPDEQVLLGLSGGVDSSVTAALLHRAIGSQLICIFIDNGLLRQNEADTVMQAFASLGESSLQLDVRLVLAQDRFLDALAGIDEPEAKRKIIGKIFIEVFEEQAAAMPQAAWFAQGTIYPDVIESAASASGKAHVIKAHHNVGGLPQRLKLKLLEPLRMLFKDEVRRIGLSLGLPAALINRHPFPGPGLGVRILGEVRPEYAELLRAADAIFIEELRVANLYDEVSQAFAVFMPVRSVGVVGDTRRYEYVIALRAVETTDFMTAAWARLPHDFLGMVATRIMNELATVSRVVYDISSKPPATIEWE